MSIFIDYLTDSVSLFHLFHPLQLPFMLTNKRPEEKRFRRRNTLKHMTHSIAVRTLVSSPIKNIPIPILIAFRMAPCLWLNRSLSQSPFHNINEIAHQFETNCHAVVDLWRWMEFSFMFRYVSLCILELFGALQTSSEWTHFHSIGPYAWPIQTQITWHVIYYDQGDVRFSLYEMECILCISHWFFLSLMSMHITHIVNSMPMLAWDHSFSLYLLNSNLDNIIIHLEWSDTTIIAMQTERKLVSACDLLWKWRNSSLETPNEWVQQTK